MANELGMFGVMPEDIQRQIQEADNNEAYRLAQLSPGRLGVAVAGQQARMAGRAIESALGVEDPRVKRAKEMQALVQEIQQTEGMDDPAKFYETMAKKLAEKGFMNEATAMYSKVYKAQEDKAGRDLKRQELTDRLTMADEKNKTAIRIAEMRAKGKDPTWEDTFKKDFKELVKEFGGKAVSDFHRILRETEGDFTAASEALTKSPKFSEGSWTTTPDGRSVFMQKNNETGEMELKGTGGTTVNVGSDKPDTEVGTKRAIRNETEQEKRTQVAKQTLPYINTYKELVKRPIISGSLADWRTAMTRFGVTLGMTKDASKLNDTDLFDAVVTELVLPKMSMLGGSDSNEELKTLLKSTGDRKTDPTVLAKIVALMEKATLESLDKQKRYDEFLGRGGSPLKWNFQEGVPYGLTPTKKEPPKQGTTTQPASSGINGISLSAIRRYQEQVRTQLGREITDEQAAARLAQSRK